MKEILRKIRIVMNNLHCFANHTIIQSWRHSVMKMDKSCAPLVIDLQHGDFTEMDENNHSSLADDTMPEDETFMREAIRLSKLAVEHGNEPFGAVLVKDGRIVFSNENQIYTRHDPTFHGEIGLIREFCAQTAITDLHEYTLYSSCEPCFMCSGAMVWVKLGRLVYGASNIELESILGNKGCNCSKMVFDNSFWKPEVTEGVLRNESLSILQKYFSKHAKG